jgi:hypothetical protein
MARSCIIFKTAADMGNGYSMPNESRRLSKRNLPVLALAEHQPRRDLSEPYPFIAFSLEAVAVM